MTKLPDSDNINVDLRQSQTIREDGRVTLGLTGEEGLEKAYKDTRAENGDDIMKLSKFKLSMIVLAIFFCFSPLGYSQGQDVDMLIQELKYGKRDDRIAAADKLGEIKDPRAVEPLIAALKDESWSVRKGAALALGEIKDPRAVEPLLGALKDQPLFVTLFDTLDENSDIRSEALQALGMIGKLAFEPLITVLKDESSGVRSEAVRALGFIKDPRAVEPLIVALKDESWSVPEGAARALGEITGKDFEQDTVKWQKWWEENKEKLQSGR